MGSTELRKMFVKFGVVVDSFIPRKRSRAGRRFGFVRYDCAVAAEVAIHQTNRIWIQDKELKVKKADYDRVKASRPTTKGYVTHEKDYSYVKRRVENRRVETQPVVAKRLGGTVSQKVYSHARRWVEKGRVKALTVLANQLGGSVSLNETYANAVRGGTNSQDKIPTVRVETIGNGWLYRSAIATFGDYRYPEAMFDSFMEEKEEDVLVRRMRRSKVLLTFPSETRMNVFIEDHNNGGKPMFVIVKPWSVSEEYTFGREVWISCYGVPVHAWNVGTFTAIGQLWGEVLCIEKDTAKCVRCNVGKVKVYTQSALTINGQMNLMVGRKSFQIRVSEEQSVFIYNSDFSCMYACHGVEDEQSGTMRRNNDEMANGINDSTLGIHDSLRLFISESLLEDGEKPGVP
ncbi:hypothetical protein Dimus_014294 [Dionaea muscipula]